MAKVSNVFLAACVLLAAAAYSECGVIPLKNDDTLPLKSDAENDSFYQAIRNFQFHLPTVGHFATHNLCKHNREKFKSAMENTLKNVKAVSGSFVREFVDSLCDEKQHTVLKLWVSEMYDHNEDGYIDFMERDPPTESNTDD